MKCRIEGIGRVGQLGGEGAQELAAFAGVGPFEDRPEHRAGGGRVARLHVPADDADPLPG